MRRVTIDLPERADGQDFATAYTVQPDGTITQVSAVGPGPDSYYITPDYGKLTVCHNCLKHRKVGACRTEVPCPLCAKGDLCKCKGDDDGDWWYNGDPCGAADDEPCRAVTSGAFASVCGPCFAAGKHPTIDEVSE